MTPSDSPLGRPLKDPAAGKRKMVSLRVSPKTVAQLKAISERWDTSQSEVVDVALGQLFQNIKRMADRKKMISNPRQS